MALKHAPTPDPSQSYAEPTTPPLLLDFYTKKWYAFYKQTAALSAQPGAAGVSLRHSFFFSFFLFLLSLISLPYYIKPQLYPPWLRSYLSATLTLAPIYLGSHISWYTPPLYKRYTHTTPYTNLVSHSDFASALSLCTLSHTSPTPLLPSDHKIPPTHSNPFLPFLSYFL